MRPDAFADAEIIRVAEPHSEEQSIKPASQIGEAEIVPEGLAVLNADAADRQDIVELALGDVVIRLVGGDAKLVEAAALRLGLEDRDAMAMAGEGMGAGEASRAGPDHRDLFARGWACRVELLPAAKAASVA